MKNIDIIVETPKGSAEKYDYDFQHKLFKLHKIMPAGMVFPYDFGFIPDTKGEDGDPLDIIIFSELKSFPGCMIECRVIGVIRAEQKEDGKKIRNDRFLAVPAESSLYRNITSYKDIPEHIIEELEQFFVDYNKIQKKKFFPEERLDAEKAYELIKKNMHKNNKS